MVNRQDALRPWSARALEAHPRTGTPGIERRRTTPIGGGARFRSHAECQGLRHCDARRYRRSEVRRDRRHRAVGHHPRRRSQQPGAPVPARRAGRRDQSLGLRRLPDVAEQVHRRAMGSARRGPNARQERTLHRAHHHHRTFDTGWYRARRDAPPHAAEADDPAGGPLLGLDSWSVHGQGPAGPVHRVRWHRPGRTRRKTTASLTRSCSRRPLRSTIDMRWRS